MARYWRMARSLDKLLAQINAYAPRRSKVSDGGIGDAAHSARTSDHNPDSRGIVHARDFTHDPKGGFDAHAFVRRLAKAGDRRVKYLISNRQISNPSISAGRWRPYAGVNPHTQHAHVSCVYSSLEDDTSPWPGLGTPTPTPAPTQEDDMKRIRNGSHDKPQVIKPGKTLKIRTNRNGDYFLGNTRKGQVINTAYAIGVTGLLQGEKARVRRVIDDYNPKKKTTTRRHNGPFHEVHGVGQGTYVRGHGVFFDGSCGYGKRGAEQPRLYLEVENLGKSDITVTYVWFDTEGN
jgi:hypothetical protein